jgi:DNA modification methylase
MNDRWAIHEGDCVEVLRTMADNSVDAIVTDPPYGLTNGNTEGFSDRLGRVLLDVVLPDLYDANVAAGRIGKFAGPLDSVTFLDFMNRSIGEKSRIAVPESPVDLKCDAFRQQEVKNARIGSVAVPDGKLSCVDDTKVVKNHGDFILQLGSSRNATLCNGFSRLFRKLDAGRFCVPVVIPCNSLFSGFLGTLDPTGPSLLADIVRLCDNPQGQPGGPAGVVTGDGTEVKAMLSFDLRRGLIELLPADTADTGDLFFFVSAAEPVRAVSGAGSLPPKFEPRTFGVVGCSANRAITFHFHKEVLHLLHYSRKGFMGKEWDSEVPTTEVWAECLRVLKPGGHLLSFAGTRTQHRMAVNIEDAGFEIRDMIAWVYGSGFCKVGYIKDRDGNHVREGWAGSLKPAMEPITMARKPLTGSMGANVLEWGTGGLNVDGCKVGTDVRTDPGKVAGKSFAAKFGPDSTGSHKWNGCGPKEVQGRWPANLIHDGSEEVVELLGSAARYFYCPKASKRDRDEGCDGMEAKLPVDGADKWTEQDRRRGEGVTRQPSKNHHPTVKPTDLMRYLCRLVTPPGGLILDPFAGSGSTGKAAMLEGFRFVGIEREAEYCEIARARIGAATHA